MFRPGHNKKKERKQVCCQTGFLKETNVQHFKTKLAEVEKRRECVRDGMEMRQK